MPSRPGLILTLHSTIGLIPGSLEHSPLHQLKASHGRFLHLKEKTFFNSVTYISDMSSNVTQFTKHMDKMIQAMDSPEASVTLLWEMLTSSPWRKTILIIIIPIVLFLLFAPCICNCLTGFLSNCLKAFKLQMVVQAPMSARLLQLLFGGPGSETLNMRVRTICCLNNLGTTPFNSRK
ncbi:unnamed protein product [Rangifer tarandus platyrhynchus]|uniref:Uncharacterized protein n=1 Tax=Rangifer tarandus platyrhynchus TaxID=3082113 RepID=A0ABN9A2H5_RANTA|nr:unnamed protein product [Rangifer tarandus platyrhynchus]